MSTDYSRLGMGRGGMRDPNYQWKELEKNISARLKSNQERYKQGKNLGVQKADPNQLNQGSQNQGLATTGSKVNSGTGVDNFNTFENTQVPDFSDTQAGDLHEARIMAGEVPGTIKNRNPTKYESTAPDLETAYSNMNRAEQRRLEGYIQMNRNQSPGEANRLGAFDSRGGRLDVPDADRVNVGNYFQLAPIEQEQLNTYRSDQRDRIDRKLEAERLGSQRREARKGMAEARKRIHRAQFHGNPVNPADLEMVKAGAAALGNVDDTEKALIAARGVEGRDTAAGQLAYNKLMQQAQKNAADSDLKERRFAFDQSKAGADQQTEMAKLAISLEKLGILDKDTASKIYNREHGQSVAEGSLGVSVGNLQQRRDEEMVKAFDAMSAQDPKQRDYIGFQTYGGEFLRKSPEFRAWLEKQGLPMVDDPQLLRAQFDEYYSGK